MKIMNTGRYEYEPIENSIFKCLFLNSEELKNIVNLKEYCSKEKIDFVLLEKQTEHNEILNLLHYTNVDNELSIDENGLIITNDNYLRDFGNGIYCVKENDITANCNLGYYFIDKDDDYEILKVEIEYIGNYYECIYGIGHKGYILIPNNIEKENIIFDTVTYAEEFL